SNHRSSANIFVGRLNGSRRAKVGDKLTTRSFNWGTRGFCALELSGTELSFADDVRQWTMGPWSANVISCHLQTGQRREAAHPSRCAGIPEWGDCSSDYPAMPESCPGMLRGCLSRIGPCG